jgi:hypothetical protein
MQLKSINTGMFSLKNLSGFEPGSSSTAHGEYDGPRATPPGLQL